MLQESVGWDTQNLIREPSTSFKIYMLFLIVVCVVTIRQADAGLASSAAFQTFESGEKIPTTSNCCESLAAAYLIGLALHFSAGRFSAPLRFMTFVARCGEKT
jgi:hypothetical protein